MSYVVRYEQLSPRKAFVRATHGRIKLDTFDVAMTTAHQRALAFMRAGSRGILKDLPPARRPYLIRKENGYTVVSRDWRNKEYESAVFTVVERN